MAYPDYKRDLSAPLFDPTRILDRYFHCGQSVVFLGASPEAEPSFKNLVIAAISKGLEIEFHPLQLVLCGSAHLGFSPVPDKLGKPFDSTKSDIDVAVISEALFDRWWKELQDRMGSRLTTHRDIAEEVFWGFINPDTVRGISSIGKKWWELFGKIQTDRAHGVRGRLYRTYWAMQSYHTHAIVEGRARLLNDPTSIP